MTRRESIQKLGGVTLALSGATSLSFSMQDILMREIPSTKEKICAVGVGTWQTFDVGNSSDELQPLRDVLRLMVQAGATVVDSSPMYGRSEEVVGKLSSDEKVNDKLFMATKVWTSGIDEGKRQIENSFRLLQRKKVDLFQIHNLLDWENHLKTLRALKEEGKIRYIGLTHYLDSIHDRLADIIQKNAVDFIQINYNIANTNAEKRLLPTAADHNVAVIINRPFQEGALFSQAKGQSLPPWAAEFDCSSWAQFFLKFILSNPHVTCVIPGTSKTKHLLDNLGAAKGRLPDETQRRKMARLFA